jgi:hypothetical protein
LNSQPLRRLFPGFQSEYSTGLVSEMNLQIRPVAAPATAAMTMNPSTVPTPWNRKPVAKVLIEAAIPIIAPTAPCARLAYHAGKAASGENEADATFRPAKVGEIKSHERAEAGLRVGDEEVRPVEAEAAPSRCRRVQRSPHVAIAGNRPAQTSSLSMTDFGDHRVTARMPSHHGAARGTRHHLRWRFDNSFRKPKVPGGRAPLARNGTG